MVTKEERRKRISRMMGVDKSQNPKIDFDTPNNIKMVAPTFDRTKNLSSESESDSIISAESVQNLSIVSAKLINVDNFLKDSLVLDKTKAGIEREKAEQDKRDVKEDKEDAPKGKWDLPGRGFLKKAKNWIMNLLFGWLVISLFKNIGQLGGFISTLIKATEFIMEWGGKFLNFFATAIDVAYDAYDKTREWVRKIAGDKGVEVFDGVSMWMNRLIAGIAAIGIAFASMVMWWPKGPGLGRGRGRGFGRGFGKGKGKGNVRSWKNTKRRWPWQKKSNVSQGVGGSQPKKNPFQRIRDRFKKPVVSQGVGGNQNKLRVNLNAAKNVTKGRGGNLNWFQKLWQKLFNRVSQGGSGGKTGPLRFLSRIPGLRFLGRALGPLFFALDINDRLNRGQNKTQASLGAASSWGGFVAGANATLAITGPMMAAPEPLTTIAGGLIYLGAGMIGAFGLSSLVDHFSGANKTSKEQQLRMVKRGENQWWDFLDWFPNSKKEENNAKVKSISQFPSYDDNEVQVSFVTLPPQVVPFTSQNTDEGQFPIMDSSASGSSPYESLYAGGLYS